MVSLMSLAVPILVAAVLVFVASSVIHMALTYHRNDFGQLPNEDDVLAAFRTGNVAAGDYVAPYCNSPESMKEPAYQEKMKRGPGLVVTVWPTGNFSMGATMAQWFVYILVVSFFTGYVLSRVFPSGADYLAVFRIAGTVAFMGYALAMPQANIWYQKGWGSTLRSMFDGLVYGLMTAGAFGWLWPR
jgi:hypothetical protein